MHFFSGTDGVANLGFSLTAPKGPKNVLQDNFTNTGPVVLIQTCYLLSGKWEPNESSVHTANWVGKMQWRGFEGPHA